MPTLPARFAEIIPAFAPLFVHRSWRHALGLLLGTILCPGPLQGYQERAR